jgi:hypothetical protein
MTPEDRPPSPEEIAAAAQAEPPPSPEDIAAASDLAPPTPEPAPEPPRATDDAAVFDVAAWEAGPVSPPYSAWTRDVGVSLVGMGGDPLTTLARAGVRVEVLSQKGERVNVQCIGCPSPWHNAGGWMAATDLQPMMRAAAPGSPLTALLPERVGWGRSAASVPTGLDRDGLCRLADRGFTVTGSVATWQDGADTMRAQRGPEGWKMDLDGAPTTASTPWRCPLTLPAE